MAELVTDQAAGLRALHQPRPVKVIAVTGGKGGVGKSNVCANLSLALARRGRQVVLLDGDLGLANLDVLMGIRARLNLEHVVNGQCALEDIVVTAPDGVRLIPAASGSEAMAALDARQRAAIVAAFSELMVPVDVLLVDTAAGVGPSVLTLAQASQHVIVVACDEPAALTDAYGVIKVIGRREPRTDFQVLANKVAGPAAGRAVFDKLARVAHRFLDVRLSYMGWVPEDRYLARAVQRQTPVMEGFPSAPSSMAFKKLGEVADNWSTRSVAGGQVEFFLERLVGAGRNSQDDLLQ